MVIAKAPAATSAVSLPCDITAPVTAASKASSVDQSATSPKGALLMTVPQPFEPGLTRVSRVAIGPVVRPEMQALPGARSTSNTGCRVSQGSASAGQAGYPAHLRRLRAEGLPHRQPGRMGCRHDRCGHLHGPRLLLPRVGQPIPQHPARCEAVNVFGAQQQVPASQDEECLEGRLVVNAESVSERRLNREQRPGDRHHEQLIVEPGQGEGGPSGV
jgi:hypothetical protein